MTLFQPQSAAPRRRSIGLTLALVLVIAAFLWGYDMGQRKHAAPTGSASGTFELQNARSDRSNGAVDFNQYWDLWRTITERYAHQPVDPQKLFYGSLQGMVASLGDPYSTYLPPAEADELEQELSGKFEGIGAEIGLKKGNLVIVAPLADSPAERAGLLPGDRILAIDGMDAYGLSVDEAVVHIRGDKGTVVKLVILRGESGKPFEVPVTRDTIRIQSVVTTYVTSPNGKRLAIMTVSNFNSDTYERFFEAAEQVNARKVDGIILDLRSNPGGFLEVAIRMLGEWSPGDVAVSERYSDGRIEPHRADGEGLLKDVKTLVLVNGGSASASEIVAGALQDHGKAVLIGTQTFGKGSVQDLVDFPDGSSVKLTIAEWLTPAGRNINENGITPDYVVAMTAEDYDNDRDPQLAAAKAWFDGVMPPTASASSTAP